MPMPLSRALALAAVAVLGTATLHAGVSQPLLRRQLERFPQTPVQKLSLEREAAYAHLQSLGIPAEDAARALGSLGAAATRGAIDREAIDGTAALASDPEAAAKAADLLTAWAELVAYGAPRTVDFVAQGIHPILATDPVKALEPGEEEEQAAEAHATPKIGGTCLTCPLFDYGPFTPLPTVYQFHSSATLSGTGDCAWYAFNVVAGNRYEFTTCSPGSATFDTVLEIYNPTDCPTLLARNDDCSASPVIRQSTLFWDATYTGIAHLKLRGFTASLGGAYTLGYRCLGIVCETCPVPNPTPLAPPTAACQCVSDTTSTSCPSDYYQVSLVAGETYRFTTCPAECASATASYDTVLRVWDPTCAIIGSNDDACATTGQTTRSTVTITAAMTGLHRIQVTGRTLTSGNVIVGSYTMCYMRLGAACATCATGPYEGSFTPSSSCGTHSSTVDGCQDNWYVMNLTAGTQCEFTTCPTAPCPGTSTFDTIIELWDPSCGAIMALDDDSCGSGRSRLAFAPPMSGAYRLRVRGKASQTGAYTLSYQCLGNTCTPPTTVSIAPTAGTVGPNTCSRTETFTLGVDPAATTPINYSWTIAPPPGGSASPSSGTATSLLPGGPASFASTLTREGAYSITVTAANGCGSVTRTITYALSDLQPPSVTAPPAVTASCESVPAAGAPTVSDNCDPSPTVTFSETRVPGSCPDSYTLQRTWTARDRSGNSASATQVVTVTDTTAPTLNGVPADQTVECDSVPAPATVTASDNCDPAPVMTFSETRVPGACPGQFVLVRTWVARDRCGNVGTRTQTITAVDTTPPEITPDVAQVACLWPPNHKYECYGLSQFSPVITDNCSLPVTWSFAGVTSNEAAYERCGDGNTDPDVILAPDMLSFCVRSERCGQDPTGTGGRTYLVSAVAVDACGNASSPVTIGAIFVPHDQRGHLMCQRPSYGRMGD